MGEEPFGVSIYDGRTAGYSDVSFILRTNVRPNRLLGVEWPLFGLRLNIGEVTLRPVVDADLPGMAAIFPDDEEQDPNWEHFAGLPSQRNRQRFVVQRIWCHRGS